jgi:putative flippase GtrA
LQIARYLLVGLVTFCTYFVLLHVLIDLLDVRYPLAVGIAYPAAVVVHFFSNRKYTFRSTSEALVRQILRYLVLIVISYSLQVSTIYVLYEMLGLDFYFAVLCGIGTTLIFGFILQRHWVFAL